MAQMLGEIKLYAGNRCPIGWAFCKGQILRIVEYEALYSILGSVYGGDGRNTFRLPDLSGRVPIGQGDAPGLSSYFLGEQVGAEEVQIDNSHLPSHSHSLLIAENDTSITTVTSDAKSIIVKSSMGMGETSILSTQSGDTLPLVTPAPGGYDALYNIQPSIVLNYMIALKGEYPSFS